MIRADIKVVLLGKENAGKTTLVDRFINNRFHCASYQSTIGAGYASCKVQVKGKPVMLGIWDTAGSERFEAMSRIYYRNARAAIVCFNLVDPDSLTRAKNWIKDLHADEEECKIYLCGTKKDLIASDDKRPIDRNEVLNYSKDVGATFFETSSKTGENVDKLFQCVAQHFISDDHFSNSEVIDLSTTVEKKKSCCST